jgi:hypothetical protein
LAIATLFVEEGAKDGFGLVTRKDDRQTSGAACAFDVVNVGQVNMQHFTVEE